MLVTGGLGCAPVVSVIHYVLKRRERFGKLVIVQGVKHAEDLIWREQYDRWAQLPDTQVLVAASQGGALVTTPDDPARLGRREERHVVEGEELGVAQGERDVAPDESLRQRLGGRDLHQRDVDGSRNVPPGVLF